MEKKRIQVAFELKAVDDEGTFEGHAAVYKNIDLGGDVLEPGVFADSISKTKGIVPILLDHDASVMSNAGFNVSAVEDGKGLLVNGALNLAKLAGREAHEMMKQAKKVGAKVALSIGFTINEDGAKFVKGVRRISSAVLWEYSIVVFGMNPKARVNTVKSLKEITDKEEILFKKKEIERLLRDADCSQTEAKRAVSVLFQCDVEEDEDNAILKSLTDSMNKRTEQLKLHNNE